MSDLHEHDDRVQDRNRTGPSPEQDFVDPGHAALSESLRWVFRLVPLGMAAILVMFLVTGVYSVDEGEVALKLRFGRIVGTPKQAGWHFRWPYPFEDHVTFATREFTFVTGSFWLGQSAAEKVRQAEDQADPMEVGQVNLEPGIDGYVLTGDTQMYHMQVRVLYRIAEPERVYRTVGGKELFPMRLRNQPSEKLERFVRGIVDPAVVKTAGRYSVTELYQGATRLAFLGEVQDIVVNELARLGCGIAVTDVVFGATSPPPNTIAAFKQVVESRNIRQQYVDRARQQASAIARDAAAEVARIGQEAEVYAKRTVALAEARRDEIKQYETQYNLQSGEPLPESLLAYLEIRRLQTIREVMDAAEERFLLTRSKAGNREIRINLDRDPKALQQIREVLRQREETARERQRRLRGQQ